LRLPPENGGTATGTGRELETTGLSPVFGDQITPAATVDEGITGST